MSIEIKVPSVGESVSEAVLAQWFKQDGDHVQKDDPVFLIETDKVTLEVVAESGGVLKISVQEGETVPIGAVVGTIETEETEAVAPKAEEPEAPEKLPEPEEKPAPPIAEPSAETLKPDVSDRPMPAPEPPSVGVSVPIPGDDRPMLSPAVRRLVAEKNINLNEITGTGPGNRITKGDILLHLEKSEAAKSAEEPKPDREQPEPVDTGDGILRKPMSPIRQRIAARLLKAKQSTAMLTTFNEIDMSQVKAFRAEYKEAFRNRYGVSLGMMSFFIKGVVTALKEFPELNAFIDGQDMVYHQYYHIGVAVGAERGLVVPVIRHADRLSFAELEQTIVDYVDKIKENRLELADLAGGTFTISNGGIYGSLLSTPILNTPQSGILGMHKIEDRPVVINGEIVVRPMMYVALSYDHRMVDGKGAVSFLKRIKECVESPERMMVEI
jgi:2-oxoglutarate dehydrogenase E2 component (dihydrolipoamide succinyltransferase)